MNYFDELKANPGVLLQVSRAHYDEAREALPPLCGDGFWAMGEAYRYTEAGAVFFNYKSVGGKCYGCLSTSAHAKQLFDAIPVAPAAGLTSREEASPSPS